MYAWLFRMLPGPLWLRILMVLVLLAVLIVVLFGWVFPAIAPYMPFNQGAFDAAAPR